APLLQRQRLRPYAARAARGTAHPRRPGRRAGGPVRGERGRRARDRPRLRGGVSRGPSARHRQRPVSAALPLGWRVRAVAAVGVVAPLVAVRSFARLARWLGAGASGLPARRVTEPTREPGERSEEHTSE